MSSENVLGIVAFVPITKSPDSIVGTTHSIDLC